MTTDLIQVPDSENDNVALVAARSTDYFSRVKLCQAAAEEVQEGKIARGGHFCHQDSNGQVTDLGPSFDALICAGRAKAIKFGEATQVSFDPQSAEFQAIAANSGFGTSCMSGPEYLIYIPQLSCYTLLFCYNATLKGVSDSIHARLRRGANFESYLFKGAKNSWFKVKVGDAAVDVPDQAEVLDAIARFRTEKSTVLEAAPTGGRER